MISQKKAMTKVSVRKVAKRENTLRADSKFVFFAACQEIRQTRENCKKQRAQQHRSGGQWDLCHSQPPAAFQFVPVAEQMDRQFRRYIRENFKKTTARRTRGNNILVESYETAIGHA